MTAPELEITAIPAFSDNYLWLLQRGSCAAVVDPGDHRPVIQALQENGLDLAYILLTHHHSDHIGGVAALVETYGSTVFGPRDQRIPVPARHVAEGDVVKLVRLGVAFEVIEVPGHTLSHIAYHAPGILFCGDTLFSIGCGRLFEGSAQQMQDSLDKLAALPPETLAYCAHEYTRSNCEFALNVEPENPALVARAEEVRKARLNGERTVPSSIASELAANPFMRTREPGVVQAAQNRQPGARPGPETMAVIRSWKDNYPA